MGALVLGAFAIYSGIQTWRGREARAVTQIERKGSAAGMAWGGRRQYQTFLGAGLMGIPGGLGFVIIGIGVWVRDLLDKPSDWGPWYTVAVIGFVLIGIAALYSVAYFFTGVPDWLRPPSQRGAPPARRRRQ